MPVVGSKQAVREGKVLMQLKVDLERVVSNDTQPQEKASHDVTQNPQESEHETPHLNVLQNSHFWVLMAAIILAIAAVVIKIEVSSKSKDSIPDMGYESETSGEYDYRSMIQLVLTIAALYIAMLLWGISQEYVMSQPYLASDGTLEKVPSALSLVLWNRIVAVIFLGSILKTCQKPCYFDGFWMGSLPSATNSIASWCQYASLNYISFALQVTVKATKLVPVVLISALRGKRHSFFDYMEVCVLSMSLVVFGAETEVSDWGEDYRGKFIGILLLVGLVGFDAMTPHLQDRIFKSNPDLDAIDAQFSLSCCACLLIIAIQAVNGSLFKLISFLNRHPDSMLHMTVLGLSSAITQYLITYTIKRYGPVSFTVIVSVRQVIAVLLSAVIFQHHMSGLAVLAMIIVLCTIMSRAARQYSKKAGQQALPDRMQGEDTDANSSSRLATTLNGFLLRTKGYMPIVGCTIAIHVSYGLYAVAQEFLAVHRFDGNTFAYPMFLVAINHTIATMFAMFALRLDRLPFFGRNWACSLIPASTNFIGTYLQHAAINEIYFPAQTLLKSLKLVPVMVVGQVCRNRLYSCMEYVEAMVITGLVAFFVMNFEYLSPPVHNHQEAVEHKKHLFIGVAMMVGYLVFDSGTVNAEDHIFQKGKLEPAQMLFGLELISGIAAWCAMLFTGQFWEAVQFLQTSQSTLLYFSVFGLAMASAVGAYSCVLTVRLFGPVVFSMLMLCRQLLSLVLSVFLFKHDVNWQSCLALVIVCNLVLLVAFRRVSVQMTSREKKEIQHDEGIKGGPSNQDSNCIKSVT